MKLTKWAGCDTQSPGRISYPNHYCDNSFSRSPPRFCDFVNGTSEQLEAVFLDIRKLYFNPGFVLQQCAYINNSAHFSKIIENPNVTEEDVGYVDEDCGGDNPIMIAAR